MRLQELLSEEAWHGTPHEFDEFSSSRIGSGEGNQAYGWGLYFASRREIADWYREQLAGEPHYAYQGQKVEPILGWDAHDLLARGRSADEVGRRVIVAYANGKRVTEATRKKALKDLTAYLEKLQQQDARMMAYRPRSGGQSEMFAKVVDAVQHANIRGLTFEVPGRVYQVEIPDEDHYLLWDSPLDQQPGVVQAALEHLGITLAETADRWGGRAWTIPEGRFRNTEPLKTGGNLYEWLAVVLRNQYNASQALREAGVAGIKFLDGNSRWRGAGTHNYVVFADSDVRITNVHK